MNADIRLLIVDDNVATRYALRRRLALHGYTVTEAGTGGEGPVNMCWWWRTWPRYACQWQKC